MLQFTLIAYFILITIHPLYGMEEQCIGEQYAPIPLKVVIADDTNVYLKILQKLFTDRDEVISVTNGNEIVDIMLDPAHKNVDLLLTDGRMTRPDGIEANGTDAIKTLRSKGLQQDMFLITSETDKAFTDGCGATAIFTKPINTSIILDVIARHRQSKNN